MSLHNEKFCTLENQLFVDHISHLNGKQDFPSHRRFTHTQKLYIYRLFCKIFAIEIFL